MLGCYLFFPEFWCVAPKLKIIHYQVIRNRQNGTRRVWVGIASQKKRKNTTLHQWICKQMSKISCIYHNLFRHIQEIKIQALPGRPPTGSKWPERNHIQGQN